MWTALAVFAIASLPVWAIAIGACIELRRGLKKWS